MEVEPADVVFEGDEIVAEIDVFLTHKLEEELAVLQHPLRPPWRPEDTALLQSIRFKPNAEILEMDYSLPGEDLYRASSNCPDGVAPIGTVHRVPLQTNYAIGVFKGNGLHLTPLHKLYAMRPDFKAIDDRDKLKEKRKEEAKIQRLKAEGKAQQETQVLKPATPHFVQQESERSKYIREHSWAYLKGLEDEEPFLNLGLVGREESLDGEYFERLGYQEDMAPFEVPWNLSPKTYLSAINPPKVKEEQISPDGNRKQPKQEFSLCQIKMMPLEHQIPKIFDRVPIIQFYTLCDLIGSEESDVEILKEVMKHALIVHGVFLVKTSKLAELSPYEKALRNVLLCYLDASGTVSPKVIWEEYGVTSATMQKLVAPLCEFKQGVWSLKISPDQKFLTNTTPEFEKARAGTKKGWVAGKKQLVAELERAAKGPKSKIQIDLKTSIELRNHGIELPEDTDGSYSMLSTLILQIFQTYGVLSNNTIAAKLRQVITGGKHFSNPKNISSKSVLTKYVPLVGINIQNAWTLKSADNPDVEPYRKLILDLFRESVGLTKQDVEQTCLKALGKSVPNSIYEKIMKEVAYKPHQSTKWIFKSGNLNTGESKQ